MRVIGQLVCGPGEAGRYLEETLKEFARLCDDVLVCLCNATDAERELVRRYDFRSYEDNREWGRFQPYIKTDLLRRIHKLGGDAVLVLDADETVPTLGYDSLRDLLADREALQLYVANLWEDERHFSKELSFWNVRAYRLLPSRGVQFLKKPVHCGNAPPYFYTLPAKKTHVPHILLHKGLMRREDRMRKAARYEQYDPNAVHKGREYYDALTAPGKADVYDQEKVLAKLREFCGRL